MILSGIVENDITAETNSKSLKDAVFCICSGIEPRLRKGDILSRKRIGRIDITEPHVGRLVHDAEMLHNWELGRKIENNIWINPDLTEIEREAKYQLHKQRKIDNLNKKGNSLTKPEMIAIPVPNGKCLVKTEAKINKNRIDQISEPTSPKDCKNEHKNSSSEKLNENIAQKKLLGLVCVTLNCQSIRNKTTDVLNFLTDIHSDIVCLQETWLNKHDKSILAEIKNDYNSKY